MGLCREIYQEGLRIPPVRLVKGGVIDREMLSLLLHNVRTPVEREGDLMAQLGACRVGEVRLQELIAKYGADSIHKLTSELLAYSERLTRAELGRMPAGEFIAEDFLDNDGYSDTPVKIRVSIIIDPQRQSARIDFTGSLARRSRAVSTLYTRSPIRLHITLSAVCFRRSRQLRAE